MSIHTTRLESLQISVEGKVCTVPPGTEVHTLLLARAPDRKREPVAAIFNHRVVSLSYTLHGSGAIQWVTSAEREGWDVVRRSACLMLYEAARRLDESLRLVLHQTHGDGLFYECSGVTESERLAAATCAALQAEMRRIAAEDLPFRVERISVDDARARLKRLGYLDKLFLLRTHWESSVRLVTCGGFADLFHHPVAYSTGVIRRFRIQPVEGGFMLRLPVRGESDVKGKVSRSPKLFALHRASRYANRCLGVENLGQLNALAISGGIDEVIRVAEGQHEKRLAALADQVAGREGRTRLVLVAGPSSSGKTTFVKRLSVQLRVNGLQPVALSVDDFFVERSRTPRDEQGQRDYECLEAIDIPLLNDVLEELDHRGVARIPRYDFHTGKHKPRKQWSELRLGPHQVLLVEGIHALNPALTPALPRQEKYGIYIAPMTQLALDDHNRAFTSDTRLIRRIIRDRRYRGYSAAQTIQRWPMVRKGEMRHIFPFREEADVLFNSALVYEHAVLRTYVERYLLEIDETDPAFTEAYRLLGFLRLVVPVLPDAVPHNSLLREFIGDSAFSYK